MPATRFILLMGVSGAGKTTIGELLAKRLGWTFIDADSLHSQANVAQMRSGQPLTDQDRAAWLDAVAAAVDACRARGGSAVVACSALRRAYRTRLMEGRGDMRLVYLRSGPRLVESRVRQRGGHFMPAALVPSQFEILEEPTADEDPIVVDAALTPQDIVARIEAALSMRHRPGSEQG